MKFGRESCVIGAGVLSLMLLMATSIGLTGCEIESAEDSVNEVGINVEGHYTNPSGGTIVQQNTGNPITTLDIMQNGDRLEAVDSNGILFKGNLTASGSGGSCNLVGTTTAGNEATFSGTFVISGNTCVMQGTWIEDSLYSTYYAKATVAGSVENNPDDSLYDPSNWTGCCSDHDGIRVVNGLVQVDSAGYAVCNDGSSSPSCNVNNRD